MGLERLQYLDSANSPVAGVATHFSFPSTLPTASFALSGVWTFHSQEATSGAGAQLELNYQAQHVYLVMGGSGTVVVSSGPGRTSTTLHVGGVPRLYTLANFSSTTSGTMVLHVSPGVQAFDFTFG